MGILKSSTTIKHIRCPEPGIKIFTIFGLIYTITMTFPRVYKTCWSKENPPYGAQDDYIIFESIASQHQFLMRPEEFDFIMNKIFDLWRNGQCSYIPILKDWNELGGFNDIQELPSKLDQVDELIDTLNFITGSDQRSFAQITQDDLLQLATFLLFFKEEGIMIRKE
jgi:hypothetical protein